MNRNSIFSMMKSRGWKIYPEPYRLNIVGVRSKETRAGYFDDWLMVFYRNRDGKWVTHHWSATLDPGLPYLHLPVNNAGTAILQMGQYVDAYTLANHRDNPNHPALCQRLGEVSVVRDNNRDHFLDLKAGQAVSGMFGINIHRTSYTSHGQGIKKEIRRDSAGCTVLESPTDYDREFLPLLRTHKQLHGNAFTYTVIDLRRLQGHRWGRRGILAGVLSLLTLLGIALSSSEHTKLNSNQPL